MVKRYRRRSRIRARTRTSFLSKKGFTTLLTIMVLFLAIVILAKPSLVFPEAPNPQPVQKANLLSAQISLLTPTPSPTPQVTVKPSPQPVASLQPQGRSVHVPVLYYHYIGNNPNPKDIARDSLSITPDRFTEEVKFLSENGYHTITYPELYAALKGRGSLPSKPVMLTFDDGYIDFYINAFPILRQYNLKSVAFLPTGKIDTAFYLHWDQIREMNSSGLVDFEAHTVDHVSLLSLSQDKLIYQLVASKNKLEAELGRPVNFMAYPYGSSDSRVWATVQKAGYLSAAGTWASTTQSEGQIFNLPRIRMGGTVSLEQFKQKIR